MSGDEDGSDGICSVHHLRMGLAHGFFKYGYRA